MPTFPVLERFAYLNAGTFGPLAQETIDAVNAQTALELERGRGGKPYFDELIDVRKRVRELLAELLGTTSEHVAVTASTTTGCQIVLSGLRLEPGDEIVTTDEEHFGLLGPLHVSGARVRVAFTRGRDRGRGARGRARRGGASDAPRRALARVLGDRPHPSCRCDQGRDGGAVARRRRAVRGRDPGHDGGDRLLHRVRPEVALWPRRDGCPVRPRSGLAARRPAHVLVARDPCHGRDVRAGGGRPSLRHGADPRAVARRAGGRAADGTTVAL